MATTQLFRNEKDLTTFKGGQMIFAAGDHGESMFVVVEGEVEVLVGDRVVETVPPGGIFGEMALIDKSARSAGARAKTNCRVAVLNEKRFTFMVHNTPFFSLEVMRTMADRLRRETTQPTR